MTTADRIKTYLDAFDEIGGDAVIGRAQLIFFSELLEAPPKTSLEQDDIKPEEVAWGFESLALSAQGDVPDETIISLFDAAFRIRASAWKRDQTPAAIDLWMLVASGVCAQKQPELRLTLQRTNLDLVPASDAPWAERLWLSCVRSFALSARKASSWEDIEESYSALEELAKQ